MYKNHISEMKGDVGMSPGEREGEQEDAYTKKECYSTPSVPYVLFSFLNCFTY